MKTSCPHCGQHFEVNVADIGKEADCANCGRRFVIKNSVKSNSRDEAEASKVQSNTLSGADLVKIFRWIRILASTICVVIAMYQMHNILNGLDYHVTYEDSLMQAVIKKTSALVDLMQPLMFMLLAIFIKPGDKDAK